MRSRIRFSIGVALICAAATPLAHAQPTEWPTRTVRVIVPSPPGGAFDSTMRPLAQVLSQSLNQPVAVENRPSGGNNIGAQAGARAAPDGYTLTMTGMINTISDGIYDNLNFDIQEDFTHIGSIGAAPQWLVVRSDSGYATLADLVSQAKQERGKINFASSGVGSTARPR